MSFLRKRGGFLNNVDGTVTSFRWTDEAPSKDGPVPFKAGKVRGADGKLKDKFHSLYFELHALADGAKEEVQTSLFAGGFEDYVVSEDGQTLASEEGEVTIGEDTAAGIFLASAIAAGVDEAEMVTDEGATLDATPIVGKRFRFVQRVNTDTTKRLGKRRDKKTGREYDRQDLVVTELLGEAEAEPVKAATKPNGAIKGTKAAAAPAKGKATLKGKAEPADEFDVAARSAEVLLGILEKEKKPVRVQALSPKILNATVGDDELKAHRDDIRTWLFANIAEVEGVTYDPATKTVTLE